MAHSGHVELVGAGPEGVRPPVDEPATPRPVLASKALTLSRALAWLPAQMDMRPFHQRCETLRGSFKPVLETLQKAPTKAAPDDVRLLRENLLLVRAQIDESCAALLRAPKLPQARTPNGTVVPRVAAIAEDYLATVEYEFSPSTFTEYVQAFQDNTVLDMAELWMLLPALNLVLLEQIAERGRYLLQEPAKAHGVGQMALSIREIEETNRKILIEPLIRFDRILREDPAGAYPRMDYASRELYRKKVVKLASHSDCSEMEVARAALALAREAQKNPDADPRIALRRSHIGTYLVAEGSPLLEQRIEYRAPWVERVPAFVKRYPDEFFLPGITALTLLIVLGVVISLTNASTSLGLILLSTLAVLVPSSQSAIQIVNFFVTVVLSAEILPKLDFTESLPADCATLVAIPTLLLDEKQVRRLVDDLEVRFLGNHGPNLHFVLLTDLPDSPEKSAASNPLVDLCSELVRGLNEKYAGKKTGSFFLLHRHPVYNPRERLWMGWERKRGKLMDLNNFLRAQFDSFPVKVGDLAVLPKVRFVITLDSDTELPRGTARRMVGALAHPLNQAIIDPDRGVVVTGYGILQPRVGVSVQSSARSRLASIYSGQTGIDIYTRAASDVYQDLYGEGIFVGKGIYEVDAVRRVLDRRFPRNALLSHDLVEGAYARAGLVSDIEIIEDYPSHYSAHNRRKHRWMRGDWQIAEWLRPLVPDESGQRVPNPLSMVSRWKILDNLRRSLFEPSLFALFLLGWLVLPGSPAAWTIATVGIVFLPALVQLAFDAGRALVFEKASIISDGLNAFADAAIADWLTITFLAHQALLGLDAMVRTIVRRLITRQRLLQWETAAQAELAGYKRTILDIYLDTTPLLALGLFFLVWAVHRKALPAAVPVLVLWAFSKPISIWLNRPPRAPRKELAKRNEWLLRHTALRTWRYFAEFSTEEHNWLVPDNVVEEDLKVAPRISTTNLGFLLNARQVACEFGYLTVPEFAEHTLRTLATVSKLQRYHGHLLNWYDTRTLAPLTPAFVSSVDNGNLVASLWTLERGCLELLEQPLLQHELPEGFLDHVFALRNLRAVRRRESSATRKVLEGEDWLAYLLNISDATLSAIRAAASKSKRADDARWFLENAEERIRQIRRTVEIYTPWLLPEFASLKNDPAIHRPGRADDLPALKRMPAYIDGLTARIKAAEPPSGAPNPLYDGLLALLPEARAHVVSLIEELKNIAHQASTLVDEMDFGVLFNRNRDLLSIGIEVEKRKLHSACYDLLPSEARMAFFVAIAKDEIPQESWFQLGRVQIIEKGIAGLLSWTGTMFEYLMPNLWMRIYPNTTLERAAMAAVRAQQVYAEKKNIPWGISESACFKLDEQGNYEYHAFGVPRLAIHKVDVDGPVISPYSTFLALPVDSSGALRNLRKLRSKGVLGPYGFYESLDFNSERARSRARFRRFEPVCCWMAHHQGMTLLALANFLHQDVVQRWFHSHPRVQATELLLQEKPTRLPKSRKNAA
ncbi:MAG: glucoamylase family protein [Candidatus Sulfotelmatobacter sp.]